MKEAGGVSSGGRVEGKSIWEELVGFARFAMSSALVKKLIP